MPKSPSLKSMAPNPSDDSGNLILTNPSQAVIYYADGSAQLNEEELNKVLNAGEYYSVYASMKMKDFLINQNQVSSELLHQLSQSSVSRLLLAESAAARKRPRKQKSSPPLS